MTTAQVFEFSANHPLLMLSFAAILGLIAFTEIRNFTKRNSLIYKHVTRRVLFCVHNHIDWGSFLTSVYCRRERTEMPMASVNIRSILIQSLAFLLPLCVLPALSGDRAAAQTDADFDLPFQKLPAGLKRFYASETEHRVLSIDDAATRPVLKKFIDSIEKSSDKAVSKLKPVNPNG